MRVGSDVAIARYAFKPSSNKSLKFQNRVLIVSQVGVMLSSSKGDTGGAFAHHGSTLLTMTPYALYHRTSKAPGVTLSPSKGDARGSGGVVLGSGGTLFKGQTSTAHGRGGLVTFAAPKVTKRRTRLRKCLFAAQGLYAAK